MFALARGEDLQAAVAAAEAELRRRPDHEDVAEAVAKAGALATRVRPGPEDLEKLGGGWVAEAALAIALCCALAASDFRDGVTRAANHSGDSDSTAAIAGNLLGARHGEDAIPPDWLAGLELREEIVQVADDLYAVAAGSVRGEDLWDRTRVGKAGTTEISS